MLLLFFLRRYIILVCLVLCVCCFSINRCQGTMEIWSKRLKLPDCLPVGIIGWRAGIASENIRLTVKVLPRAPATLLLCSAFQTYAYMYLLIWILVFALHMSVLISSFLACLHSLFPLFYADVQSFSSIFIKFLSYILVTIWFFSSLSMLLMNCWLMLLGPLECDNILLRAKI